MLRVLLVDDEQIAVNALKNRVEWKKYNVDKVFTANSMAEAQEIFHINKIDFILCDIEMPNGSGLELYEWVKIYYPKTECIYITCHLDYEYMRKALKLGSSDYILKPIHYKELDEILMQLVTRLESHRSIEKIPSDIVNKIIREEAAMPHDDTIHKVKRYILDHIQDTIYVEDIADQVHLNAQYLMRLFKKSTDMSLLEYITNERVKLAIELLGQTDLSINKVADCVGYANYCYFTKIFKRSVGVSPKEYRQQYKM